VYLRSVGEAWLMSWRPTSDYPYLRENREAIEPWSRFFARYVAGQPRYPVDPQFLRQPGQIGYFAAAAHVLSLLFGLGLVVVHARARTRPGRDALFIFLWLQIAYVAVVGNALEIGENQRYRFYVMPLVLCMVAELARRLWLRVNCTRP